LILRLVQIVSWSWGA